MNNKPLTTFLLQKIDGEIKHDFSFTLIESINYQNWINYPTNIFGISHVELDDDLPPKHIPIGSVEFVLEYLKKHFNLFPKPKNIPKELMSFEFTGRKVINGTEKDIIETSFVKSNDDIKKFTEYCKEAPIGNYQISEIIEIDSEWRGFVFNNELVGLQNYTGEFDLFPDVRQIKKMIRAYKSAPIAYTIDVGISKKKTVIIEVHDFFSCGLYGFSDHRKLPFMFLRWFYNYTHNINYNNK